MAKNITIKTFDALTRSERADIIQAFGQYLIHYETARHIFSLYQLSDFYVEMVYNTVRRTKLIRIKSHATPDTLQKYLLKVDLTELGLVL